MTNRLPAALLLLTCCAAGAAPDACGAYGKLRAERDAALRARDKAAYCAALRGLISLHPDAAPSGARLACEVPAGSTPKAWLTVRSTVVQEMKATEAELCR